MSKSFWLNLFFPLTCLGCGREGDWLCPDCFKKIKFSDAGKTANLQTPALDYVFVAGDYDNPLLASLIKHYKYQFVSALGSPLAHFLVLFWSGIIFSRPELRPTPDFLLIPIPLTKKRERWRGFNQAEILACEFQKEFDYSLSHNLKRVHDNSPQASLSESERLINLKNSFRWVGSSLVDRTIILIDDVTTTGTTLNEAALVLRSAGAAKIYGLVLAKG